MDEVWHLSQQLHRSDDPQNRLLATIVATQRDILINQMLSHAEALLLVLLKRTAEKRTMRSWDMQVQRHTLLLQRMNQQRLSATVYFSRSALQTILREVYQPALMRAAYEAFEGMYDAAQFARYVNETEIIDTAVNLILPSQSTTQED